MTVSTTIQIPASIDPDEDTQDIREIVAGVTDWFEISVGQIGLSGEVVVRVEVRTSDLQAVVEQLAEANYLS